MRLRYLVFVMRYLLSCRLNVSRLLVFLTMHSDPDRGDLHSAKGFALTPNDVRTSYSLPLRLTCLIIVLTAVQCAIPFFFDILFKCTQCCLRPACLWRDSCSQAIV